MKLWLLLLLNIIILNDPVKSAFIADNGDVDEQGLYSKSDQVIILTSKNFDRRVYGQKHSLLVEFYNSYCGHCRAFAPKFKSLAADIVSWKNVIQLAVLDCSVEENNEICRQFEIMAYPSFRYIHENYVKGNANVGERFESTDSAEKLKAQLIVKLQTEQSMGRLRFAPSLDIASYASYTSALSDVPNDVTYTFLVFENANSTVGSELALDTVNYKQIRVKRVFDNCELANIAGVTHFPGLVAVRATLEPTPLTPKVPTKVNLLKAVNTFLKSKNYVFPVSETNAKDNSLYSNSEEKLKLSSSDVIYYSDLEKTLKTIFHTEITRHKTLKGEELQALLNFLDILVIAFPFKGNLKSYTEDLLQTLRTRNEWGGSEVYDIVKSLEKTHAPVYTTDLDYIGCKGSQPKYRGYTCGLWTLFHTLTVNSANKPGVQGPKVLTAMHGYVKHFFGCTECAEHFQAMATRNRLFNVKENDKAILWLWISHNEVNLRLAGDVTEDPEHPKIQYPTTSKCPECRLSRGAWNLPAVYEYLQRVYGADNIQEGQRVAKSSAAAPSPFSDLDIGMLSLLLIFWLGMKSPL
ncbi:PREDICTED: sulfhydryl oxidase 2-like isoform X1 [Papilio polytes]|uniref:sulfhydryl oxidase 2-like isoform X1 n=1 Tax=Papilio polytes TaxID=76194 RepID=UPI0006761DAD|nr:PREDICTED: sulfhydryl oxidase 2-like isoform X1 [Papilio polytes]